MSVAKDEQESTETLRAWLSAVNVSSCFALQKHYALCRQSAFRCKHERCRLMRGHSGFWQVRRVSEANPARPDDGIMILGRALFCGIIFIWTKKLRLLRKL